VDHIPLCFEGLGHPWVAFLVKRFPDPLERAEQMLALGLDTGYTVRRWSENRTVAGRSGRGKGLLRLLSRVACVFICLVSDLDCTPRPWQLALFFAGHAPDAAVSGRNGRNVGPSARCTSRFAESRRRRP